MLPYDRPILIVPDDPADVPEVVTHLLRVGFDDVQGYLEGGLDAWETHGFELGRLETISVHDLATRLAAGRRPAVRARRAHRGGVGGRAHRGRTATSTAACCRSGSPRCRRDRPVAVVCGTGYRASIAASFLKREGYEEVTNVLGGMTAWKAAGLPGLPLDHHRRARATHGPMAGDRKLER